MTVKRKSMVVGPSMPAQPRINFVSDGCNRIPMCADVNANQFYHVIEYFARFAVLTALVFIFSVTPGLFGQNTEVLTNLAQVNAWPLAKATNGVPVHVRVTITYKDPDWQMTFAQDDTGSLYVERNMPLADALWNLPPGQVVDLVGTTSRGVFQCNLNALQIRAVRPGPLPKPWLLDSEVSYKNAGDARWVKVTGVITGVRTLEKKLDLDLRVSPNRTLRLIVAQGDPVNAATLLGCVAEATGALGFDLDAHNKPTGRYDIWVNDLAGIQSIHALPVTPVTDLTVPAQNSSAQIVRVLGNVIGQSPVGFLTVQDSSGSVRVNCADPTLFRVGGPVEAFGYVARQEGALVLTDTTVLAPNAQLVMQDAVSAAVPLVADSSLPELKQIAQVRELPASEAMRGYPVDITGVLTFVGSRIDTNAPDPGAFIQDSSGGIFLDPNRKKFDSFPEASQLVEIKGFTGPGGYAPVIEAEHLRVLGDATLPGPKTASMQVLMTGAEDSQWVALNGMVRSQTVEGDETGLSLAAGDSLIEVVVPNAAKHPAPRNFVDAWVEVRGGVCVTVFDNQRHLMDIKIYVPNWNEVRTWTVGADDPFKLAVRPLNQLLAFHSGGEGLHRAHVRGEVTLCRADGSFYLQDATSGILVQAQAAPDLVKVGQILDVVGFPSVVNKWPVMQEATVRAATNKLVLQPVLVQPEALLSRTLHGVLVHLQARVIEHTTAATVETLRLQTGPWITDAILEKNNPDAKLGGMEPGSTVELTGVYLARLDDNLNVESFQLMLRSPADVRVLARPSWWTAQRVLWLVATLGIAFALVLAWVTLLHRQVHERTRELRGEIEERKRMEAQVAATHKELLVASRGAGMAEIATNVLHNVGNVLNSVNVSATLVADLTRKSKVTQLGKAVALLDEHAADLASFLSTDPKGMQLPGYLRLLNEHLAQEQQVSIAELESLHKNIEHINEIVAMQQNYAKISGVTETVDVSELVEDALRMNEGEHAAA